MKGKTKNLTQKVQDALLGLSDSILMETITEWLELAEAQLLELEWVDEYRYALGYCIQSDETDKIYSTFEELNEAEPDGSSASWVVPDVHALRDQLSNLSLEEFYHTVISLAGAALSVKGPSEGWGLPPSSTSDGYDFMRCLAVFLQYKAYPRPKDEHFLPFQETGGRRKSMKQS